MRKFIPTLVVVAALIMAVQAQASIVTLWITYGNSTKDSGHPFEWSVWATDTSDNMGISGLTFYVNGATITNNSSSHYHLWAPYGTDQYLNTLGFSSGNMAVSNSILEVNPASTGAAPNGAGTFLTGVGQTGQSFSSLVSFYGPSGAGNDANELGTDSNGGVVDRAIDSGIGTYSYGAGATSADGMVNPTGTTAFEVASGMFIGANTTVTLSGGVTPGSVLTSANASVFNSNETTATSTGQCSVAADQVLLGEGVPEPASMALLGLGGLLLVSRRRARA